MGESAAEKLDQRWQEHVRRQGLNLERADAIIERGEREGRMKLKRISFKSTGAGYLVIVTAEVDGKAVVQFANVESLATGPGAIARLLQEPVWKSDKWSEPAPHIGAEAVQLALDLRTKKQ
jgi:hypothetical protein